jgi:hypothetical protein
MRTVGWQPNHSNIVFQICISTSLVMFSLGVFVFRVGAALYIRDEGTQFRKESVWWGCMNGCKKKLRCCLVTCMSGCNLSGLWDWRVSPPPSSCIHLARPGSEARFECILPVCIRSCKSCSTCSQPNILLGKFYMAPCVQAGRSRAPFVSPCLQWWAISKLPHTLISLGGCFDATSTALHNWQNAIHGQQCFAAPPLCRPSSQGNSKTNKSTSEAGKPVLKYESHRSCFADVVNWFQVIFQLPAT